MLFICLTILVLRNDFSVVFESLIDLLCIEAGDSIVDNIVHHQILELKLFLSFCGGLAYQIKSYHPLRAQILPVTLAISI